MYVRDGSIPSVMTLEFEMGMLVGYRGQLWI